MNFALHTLGCKLNQLEGEALADAFRKAGFALTSQAPASRPDIIIVNTCTVTSKADQKCRRVIRKALRENPDSCVIVTGCYARLDHQEIAALENEAGAGFHRLFVAGGGGGGTAGKSIDGTSKSALLELPEYVRKALEHSPDTPLPEIVETWIAAARAAHGAFDFKPEEFAFHSRGYLKIQDGCDHSCSYCRVRLARGPSVSLPKESALERLRSFEARGCAELMITGVNITQYRHSDTGLAGLLQYLLEGSTTIALRLSSLEPEAIDERLAAVLAHPRIRPHFHLSVQSGSDTVLRAMGRAYTSRTVENAAALLRGVKDNPFLACDIIAGFPGETAADFDQTLALCAHIGFAWIHAFPYSKRPGTAAFSLKNPVCDRDITRRVEALTQLALQGRRNYAQSWLGRELSAVVEKTPPCPTGRCPSGQCRAVSENYLKLIVNGSAPPPGSVIRCTPMSLCDGADGENPDAVAAEL
jgi:threonylcarbamoyladenosine tRNA methylthiotransferase MtaB